MADFLHLALSKGEISEFYSKYWGNSPLYKEHAGDWSSCLFSMNDLNTILDTHSLTWPHFRLVSNGEGIDPKTYVRDSENRRGLHHKFFSVDAIAVENALRDGATLVLDGIDRMHHKIRDSAVALERSTGSSVSVNAYLTCGMNSQGFDLHWDDHDVFVIQVSGRKKWRIQPPTRKWPLWFDTSEASKPKQNADTEILDIELKEGDFLYVPHGWWHEASASETHSLHLTIGVKRLNGVDFLEWITDFIRDDDVVRAPMPEIGRDVWTRSIKERFLEALDSPQIANRFLAEVKGRSISRTKFDMERVLQGYDLKRCSLCLAPDRNGHLDFTEDGITLFSRGFEWGFPKEFRDVVQGVLEGNTIKLSDLVDRGIEEEDAINILYDMVMRGVLKKA